MKKNFFALSVILLFIAGCRYDDGPKISFRSPEQRLKGYYDVDFFSINDIDSTSYYMDSCGCDLWISPGDSKTLTYLCVLTACKDGKGEDTWGSFLLSTHRNKLFVSYDSTSMVGIGPFSSGTYTEWDIQRLTNKNLWMKTTFNGKDYKVKLVKKKV
jgi:hypothetical protein